VWVACVEEGPTGRWSWRVEHAATLLLPGFALIGGGVGVALGATVGLYWVLGAILLAFVSAAVTAWVVLVEITR
jgi:hypothetical protein